MQINKAKFEQVVKGAKAKVTDRRWLNAIDKASEGILNGAWIVTELHGGCLITTENGTYHANGVCQCKAFVNGQPCKHRAAARLIAIYNETGNNVLPVSRAPRVIRNIESDRTGIRFSVVRCDGWNI
jgi:hypothetical protein